MCPGPRLRAGRSVPLLCGPGEGGHLSSEAPGREWQAAQPGQGLAYGFLARCFHEPPDDGWLARLDADRLLDVWPLPSDLDDVTGGLAVLRATVRRRAPQAPREIVWDHTRLFIGPGEMLAPPWESVHRSRRRLTFQEVTLEVRALYAEFGLESPTMHAEPDDHLALELAFVAHLSGVAAAAGGDDDVLTHCHAVQRRFLDEHLLAWAPACLALVETHARTDFYRGLARLTRGTLHESARLAGITLP